MNAIAPPANSANHTATSDSPFRQQQHQQPPQSQRSSKQFLLPPGSSSGHSSSALASLARGSLMMGLSSETNPNPNASSSSLGLVSTHSGVNGHTPTGESSNMIIGPNGVLVPRSSILLNRSTRKSLVDNWRVKGPDGSLIAPAVLRIPAVPTLKEQKERELQREFERAEREREIEREVREKEQAEKVWGIPRKAFYLGLGEINFNAQMAMLGGWGNGSGGMGVDVANRTPLTSKATRRKSTPVTFGGSLSKKQPQKTRSGRPSSSHGSIKRGHEPPAAPKPPPKEPEESDSDESMDLEELAALNAIINTRRSMEAAQVLASGMYAARPTAAIKRSTSSNEALRKSTEGELDSRPAEERQESMESVPTLKSTTTSAVNESGSDSGIQSKPAHPRRHSDNLAAYPTSSRIRFAPLPHTYTPSQAIPNVDEDTSQTVGITAQNGDTLAPPASKESDRSTEEVLNTSKPSPTKEREDVELDMEEEMDGDESWTRRWSGSKSSKWYLMGMPKSVFSPQYYRTLRRPMSGGSHDSSMTATQFGANSASLALSDSERRGRRRSRSKRASNSRASSIKSRSSSIGSMDEEERDRRRQLILASRPGGTGMVTLPDGRKIRARRVGEAYSDDEGDQTQASTEVGLGALAKAAERQGLTDDERQTGEKRMSDDEGGRESDFGEEEMAADDRDSIRAIAKMKRRKREASMDNAAKPAEDESVFISDSTQEASNDTVLQSDNKKSNAEKTIDEAAATSAIAEDESDSDSLSDEEADQMAQSISRLDEEKLSQGRMPKRSTTMPSGPITLSASQAAEVRRRHEEEVAALGAEVLHNIAKAKKAKQMQYDQQQQQQQGASTRQQQTQQQKSATDKFGHQDARLLRSQTVHHTGQSNSPGLPTQSTFKNAISQTDRGRGRDVRSRTQTSAEDEVFLRSEGRHSRLSPLRHSLRTKPRTQSVHVNRAPKQTESNKQASYDVLESLRRPDRKGTGSSSSVSRLPRVSTPPRIQSDTDSRPITPTRRTADDENEAGDLTASVSSVRTLRGAGDIITDFPLQSSPLSQGAVSPSAVHSLHDLHNPDVQTPSIAAASMPNVAVDAEDLELTIDSPLAESPSSSLRTASIRSFRRSRIPDLPSPWDLPRRPDARGYAVVPLPGNQLGRRPDRPREGRFWQTDEEDGEENDEEYSSTEDEMPERPYTQKKIQSTIDSDDEQESDMDAEQLAEEERRTAVQKKRATTRAAGAELVSSLTAKQKNQSQNNLATRSATRLNSKRSTSANRQTDANGKYSQRPANLSRKSAEFPISGQAPLLHRHSKSSNQSVTSNGSSRGDASNDVRNGRPILSRTVVSTSRDRKGNHVAKITRERDTWNDFDDHESKILGKKDVLAKLKIEDEDGDSSDVDDLWPPTLDNALGSGSPLPRVPDLPSPIQIPLGKSTSRPTMAALSAKSSTSLSSSIGSSNGAMISPIGDVSASAKKFGHSPTSPNGSASNHSTSSAIRLAMHATKAKIVREKREKEQREREREKRRKAREMDESLDYGWPKSLQGSSLY
ncbi:uncharacterized protein FA14DRAFT_152089 [Meira miltonrushii]|uniref:Uncharacterized protein n=1 Tax=Meira miltonrushii TaxID=1280837 RepID=A0A316VGM9_9BASI|nr:uncharacterized protein FA14DRAFT_152089 [Meira miltonrushii]PWN36660.1 hypothetical protein FA14DRAFT_152089 [Meira miltonrushii]